MQFPINRRLGKARDFAHTSISGMDIFVLPRKLPDPFVFSSVPDFEVWLSRGEGIHGIERRSHRHFAWMKPDASIILLQAANGGKYKLAVTMVSHRPSEYPAEPQWVWNGVEV